MPPHPLSLYRGLLRAARYYPSKNREKVADAIREEFRANKELSGKKLEDGLWLAVMELQRLETWVPTKRDLGIKDKDLDVKL